MIYSQKSHFAAPLMHCCKTKFLTVYPTIYLPKGNFCLQLSPNFSNSTVMEIILQLQPIQEGQLSLTDENTHTLSTGKPLKSSLSKNSHIRGIATHTQKRKCAHICTKFYHSPN